MSRITQKPVRSLPFFLLSFLLVISSVLTVGQASDSYDGIHALYNDLERAGIAPGARSHPDHASWNIDQTGHFLVVGHWDKAQDLGPILEGTHRAFYESFSTSSLKTLASDQPLHWVVFADRNQFEQYAQQVDRVDMSWSDGYYSSRTNRVAVFCESTDHPADHGQIGLSSSTARLTHEAAHQLAFNSGLQKRGVVYPLWVAEGLATNFEARVSMDIGPEQDNPYRLAQLKDSVTERGLIPIRPFLRLTRPPVDDPTEVHDVYAQSWAFFKFLHSRYPSQLRNYLDAMARRPSGRMSGATLYNDFVRHFGEIDALDRSWKKYVRTLIYG